MARKTRMISMRITDRQFHFIDDMAKRIKSRTGFRITRASIMLKLMEYGLPLLEKEFPESEEERMERHERKRAS